MAQQTINIGTAANDGSGDPLRTAFDKCNDNFTEIYNAVTALQSTAAFEDVARSNDSESCDGTVEQVIVYSSPLINAQSPIIVDKNGIGIEVTAFDDDGFTITSLAAGTFGYLTTIQV
jgi:hypothetical protein